MKKLLKWLTPYGLIELRRKSILKKQEEQLKRQIEKQKQIREYFLSLDKEKQDEEIQEIIHYFEKGFPFSVFPYLFSFKSYADYIDVYFDNTCNMPYIFHNGKKMYFPKIWKDSVIRAYYNDLLIEQDVDSPHRYETAEYTVKEGDVIADIGAAEGIWALTYAEKASKIYLFECEKPWIEALEKTFEPWKEKVVIVNKFVSDVTNGSSITLDDFLAGNKIDVIKADIEGAERKLLEGAGKTLSTSQVKLLLCCYHRENDDVYLKDYLDKLGFITEHSKGFMLFIYDPDLKPPYYRRGLLRAGKQCRSLETR